MNGNIWESNTQEYLNYGQDQDRFWFQSYEEEELNYSRLIRSSIPFYCFSI